MRQYLEKCVVYIEIKVIKRLFGLRPCSDFPSNAVNGLFQKSCINRIIWCACYQQGQKSYAREKAKSSAMTLLMKPNGFNATPSEPRLVTITNVSLFYSVEETTMSNILCLASYRRSATNDTLRFFNISSKAAISVFFKFIFLFFTQDNVTCCAVDISTRTRQCRVWNSLIPWESDVPVGTSLISMMTLISQ